MRRLLLIAIVVVLGFGSVRAAAPVDLPGKYLCAGTQGPDKYTVTLTIEKFDETYQLIWLQQEHPVLGGLGLTRGDQLAVGLFGPNGAVGVALYTVTPGRLEGEWSRGDGKVDIERCMKGDKQA